MGKESDSRVIVQAIIRGLPKAEGWLEGPGAAKGLGAFELRAAFGDVLIESDTVGLAPEKLVGSPSLFGGMPSYAVDAVQIDRMIHRLVSRTRVVNGLLAI